MRIAPIALLAGLALGACERAPEPAAAVESQAASGPEAKPGLTLNNGRLVLPAVAGNPGAAYFELANGGAETATVAAISIDRAGRAEMHETSGGSMAPLPTLELARGKSVAFEPGGKHVMVFDLEPTVAAGTTAEMTITFADGDKVSAPLKVEPAGGMGDHSAMN